MSDELETLDVDKFLAAPDGPDEVRDFPGKTPGLGPKFSLAGEQFQCIGAAPAGRVADLTSAARWPAELLVRHLASLIVEADRERFHGAVRRTDVVFEASDLSEVISYVIEQILARPTTASGPSSNGSPPGNVMSGASSSSPDATREPSIPEVC